MNEQDEVLGLGDANSLVLMSVLQKYWSGRLQLAVLDAWVAYSTVDRCNKTTDF